MQTTLFILFLFFYSGGYSQKDSLLLKQSILFHQKLISNDEMLVKYLDKNLSYGHSNGWIETKPEMIENLRSGKIKYIGIKEDSLSSDVHKKLGWIRFVAETNVLLEGKALTLRLRVLEIWRKSGTSWKLYARQAVRA